MTLMHFDWLSSLDIKLTATAVVLVLSGTLALVIVVALVAKSRYLANVSLFDPIHPLAKIKTLHSLMNLSPCLDA